MKYNISVPGRDNSTRSHCLRCLFHLHKGGRPVQIRSRSKSFLQEWTCKQDQTKLWYISISLLLQEWTGRISAQSLNSELKMATPPGDEIWAQKCHELDFQVGSIWIFNILPPSPSPITIIVFFPLLLLKIIMIMMTTGGSPQGGAVQPAGRERGSLWEGARRSDTLEKGSA